MSIFRRLLWLFLLGGLVLASIVTLVASRTCMPWESVPTRSFTVEELLIDISVFPRGWTPYPGGASRPSVSPLGGSGAIEPIEIFFETARGGAFEQIHRFACPGQASDDFEARKRLISAKSEFRDGLSPPDELQYQSVIADQFYLGCEYQGDTPQGCAAIARYHEYVIVFNTHMFADSMTFTDLEHILRTIDSQMAVYLEAETQ